MKDFLGFDRRNRDCPLLKFVMFILHRDVCWLQSSLERVQRCPGVAVASACGAVKLYGSIHSGRVNRKVTCRYECVHADSSAHNVVADPVDKWIRCLRYGELHVRVANRSKGRVEEKFVVEKVGATSVKRCHYMPVSVRSSEQFLYSRSPEKIPVDSVSLNNPDISLVLLHFKKFLHQISPRHHEFRRAVPRKSKMLQ